jgi:aminopeptidase N
MMLRQLIENASDVKVKATATLGLVGLIEKLADLSDSDIERYSKRIGEKFEAYAEKYSDGKADEEINRLLQLCVDEYSDVKGRGRQTIGELAAMQLQAMNLKVGRVAPDIIGEDLDGVSFKLSDYRGKVVMLDFWGDW